VGLSFTVFGPIPRSVDSAHAPSLVYSSSRSFPGSDYSRGAGRRGV
jgi:hypothetical protein